MSVTPFQLASLALDGARRGPLNSAFGPFPEPLENSQGFRIAGIVSHEFFRAYALTLDFTRMQLLLQPAPETREPEAAVDERMPVVAGKIMAAINSGDYEALEQDFGPVMRAALPVEKLKQAMDGLLAKMGHIERLGKGKSTGANQATFPAYFERGALDLKIYLDNQNHLAGMGFQPADGSATAKASAVPASPNLIGKPAPEFRLRATDGRLLDLAALRGKVVLLDFWASWCGPCRRQLPMIEKIHQDYRGAGLVVIGVDVGEEKGTLAEFLRSASLTYPVVLLPWSDSLVENLSINRFPTAVLIDRKGQIEAYLTGEPENAALGEETEKLVKR